MTIQKQLSTGDWKDVDDAEVEKILSTLEAENGILNGKFVSAPVAARGGGQVGLSCDEVIAALTSGLELRRWPGDWYANARMKPAPRAPRPEPTLIKCSCGHTVPASQVMTASMGTSCPNCYDEMSN
jgi:hypothetical protein